MLWKLASYANSHQERRMIIRWLEAMVKYFPLKPPTHPTIINSFANHLLKSNRIHSHSQHRHSASSSTHAGRSPARRRPSPPPPPRCLSVDSACMILSGKIVFKGLERSSSSPCSFQAASKSQSRAAVDRSYSSGVRVVLVVIPSASSGSRRRGFCRIPSRR